MLRLSKRAVRSRVLSAIRVGSVEEFKSGRGQATVRLTARGSDVAARWKPLQDAAGDRWRKRIGVDRTRNLRASLEQLVAMMPLEHPASYGAADARITGGNGKDWKGVPRKTGDTVSHLPLSALVSEALVAFAMAYEEKSPVALSLSAGVSVGIPAEGRPLRELGYSVGVAAMNRHGFVRVSAEKGDEVVWLTPKGLAARDAHEERVRAVEAEWRDMFRDKRVTALRRALEDVARISPL